MATLSAWVSDEEKARCSEIAKRLGVSESSIIRQAFMTAEILDVNKVKLLEIDRLCELQRIEKNINVITSYCKIHKAIDFHVYASCREIEDDVKNF